MRLWSALSPQITSPPTALKLGSVGKDLDIQRLINEEKKLALEISGAEQEIGHIEDRRLKVIHAHDHSRSLYDYATTLPVRGSQTDRIFILSERQ